MKNLVQLVETALGDSDRDWWFPAEGRVIPLSDLWSSAAGMAGRLSDDHGVRPGDRVLVVLENGSDYVSLLLAIWRLGVVVVPIRPYGGRHFWFDAYLAELARIANYRLIVQQPGIAAFDTAAVVARLGRPCIAVDALKSGSTTPVGPVAGNRPEDHAVIQFTSGSTGQPKGRRCRADGVLHAQSGALVPAPVRLARRPKLLDQFRAGCQPPPARPPEPGRLSPGRPAPLQGGGEVGRVEPVDPVVERVGDVDQAPAHRRPGPAHHRPRDDCLNDRLDWPRVRGAVSRGEAGPRKSHTAVYPQNMQRLRAHGPKSDFDLIPGNCHHANVRLESQELKWLVVVMA